MTVSVTVAPGLRVRVLTVESTVLWTVWVLVTVAVLVTVVSVVLCLVGAFVAVKSDWVREKVPFVKKLHGWQVGYLGMQAQAESMGEDLLEPGDEEEFTIGGDEDEEVKGGVKKDRQLGPPKRVTKTKIK